MDHTTLTANLKPLERRGLIATMVDKEDRRGRRLALTEAGRGALATAMPLWRRAQAENEGLLHDMDADCVRAAFRALS
jgi:DNA-binding MarR family transcriptional regulator